MARKIVTPVEVQASVTGDQSVKSFRAQLREAQQEALRVAQALGQTSPQAQEAARRVAELKDQMDDFNATVAGMHPDKFEAVGKVVGTLANGFAAAQGAAALLGSESEDLQKAMVRVQGAMALAQGVAGFKDLQFVLAGVRTFMLTQLVPAFTTVAGAARMIGAALGIGIIIAGVTLLIDNWGKLTAAFRRFANLPDHDKIKKDQDARILGMEREIELMEARGESEEKIMLAKADAIIAERKMIATRQKQTAEDVKRFGELGHELDILVAKAWAMRRAREKQQAEDEEKRRKEAEDKRKTAVKTQQTEQKKEKEIELKMLEEMELKGIELADETLRQKKARMKEELAFAQKTAIDQDKLQAAVDKVEQERNKKRLADEKAFQENKRQLAIDSTLAVINLLDALTSNSNARNESERKKEFERQKAFQIASTVVSTYAAAQKAYQSQMQFTPDSPIRAAIAAAIAVASGLARVAAIKKQQFNASAPGGLQQPGNGGIGGIQQPSFTSSTLGGGTQFAGSFDNKVYVTEGDITGTQRRVRQNRGVSVI